MILNDDLQKVIAELLKAKANETKFEVFQKELDFGLVTILEVALAIIAIVVFFKYGSGIKDFLNYIR